MSYRVEISSDALAAVERFLDFVAIDQQAPLISERWWQKALIAIQSLEDMPHRCPYAPENQYREYTIRMMIVDRCLFLYTVIEETQVVRVIGFRHGSQLPKPAELPPTPE